MFISATEPYYFSNSELKRALALIDIAIKRGPQPWHYRLKMDILEKMNRNNEAVETGQDAIKFIQENEDKLGWNSDTRQESIRQFNTRIEDLKVSTTK